MPAHKLDDLVAVYLTAVRTKMQGCLLKSLMDLDKDATKLEACRSKLRAEIKKACGKYAKCDRLSFDYKCAVPQCMIAEIADVVSMRRASRRGDQLALLVFRTFVAN